MTNEVEAYFDAQPLATRKALQELKECILKAAPHATEGMNYNIPAYALVSGGKRDQQIMIAGYPKHVGLYPHPDVIEAFSTELVDYKYAKGSVQFSLQKPIPKDLVVRMVKMRMLQLGTKA